jgi:hypothetical protein
VRSDCDINTVISLVEISAFLSFENLCIPQAFHVVKMCYYFIEQVLKRGNILKLSIQRI